VKKRSIALTEVGLTEQAIPLALLSFKVGVQLLFIGVALALVALAKRTAIPQPAWAARVPAYGIGAMAMFWTIEGVVGF
jgi:hypothetical protein